MRSLLFAAAGALIAFGLAQINNWLLIVFLGICLAGLASTYGRRT